MIDSQRIYAPRPVKAHSNINCLKKIKNFERVNNSDYTINSYPPSKSQIPDISESELRINSHHMQESKIPKSNKIKFINNLSETFETFSKQVDKDFKSAISDSKFKSEIFSILKSETATNFGSNSSSYPLSGESDEDNLNQKSVRFSKPPERSKNPCHKNFEMESQNCIKKIDSITQNYTIFFEYYFSEDVIESNNIENLER